ncbi:MAG: methyltransferase family protein [Vulcanimicrobiaceae bacterium]
MFLPAWTLDYGQGWAFLGAFGAYSAAITIYLMKTDPALLERRVRGGPQVEKAAGQQIAMTLASFGFVAILVVSAFDHRAHPFGVPPGAVWLGEALVALGFLAVSFVFRENSFSSATIEDRAGPTRRFQRTYAVVRHPMYAGASLYVIGMPLALGSWWGFAGAVSLVAVRYIRKMHILLIVGNHRVIDKVPASAKVRTSSESTSANTKLRIANSGAI